jgi:hypothetical protein
MRKLLCVLTLALALVAAPAAGAGGFATVGLSSLPAGTAAGETWTVDLKVLAHGRTPVDGIAPLVRITGGDGQTREFAARPTGETGVYRADVVFPREGTWRYEVWDGYTQTHTFKAVAIGTPADGSFPYFSTALAAVLALALAGSVLVVRRRGSAAPLPAS